MSDKAKQLRDLAARAMSEACDDENCDLYNCIQRRAEAKLLIECAQTLEKVELHDLWSTEQPRSPI